MDKKEDIGHNLTTFKEELSRVLPIDRMIFFGSRAAGKAHKDSDIDLIIVSEGFREKKFRERSLGFYKYWHLDYPVDFLCYTPEEFDKKRKQVTIVREAVRKGLDI